MDPCYQFIAQWVKPQDWEAFSKRLLYGFKGFPAHWELPDDIRERLILKLQWHFFNPDQHQGIADKRARSWGFITSFLSDGFQRKLNFLRTRLDQNQMLRWDQGLADFETLLLISSMSEEMQLDWLATFDATVRYGKARRARVIKSNGLGLFSKLLGVEKTMVWSEVRTRYRFMLKRYHPDMGGDAATTQAIVEEFAALQVLKEIVEKKRALKAPNPDWLRGD